MRFFASAEFILSVVEGLRLRMTTSHLHHDEVLASTYDKQEKEEGRMVGCLPQTSGRVASSLWLRSQAEPGNEVV